ncbi:mannitol-1-phosphate 5-dehydrogenase [Cohnella rhizosphaerae]|uniref:Mannitol-1-phosphate 5-dehydrogenase n=1 Tax=Cohnella rhizosphaerae TaxID=1457232 RepID=A0A9X4KYA6_9BACL|nr:mannitol-1-phosphate 5-dehydrogenase [Cohnella rhizosphaerae]MDG0810549.1 mannitol-1-phosphate 5-dehydrogenase [Cohnella rhizosphaerae]
MSASINTTVSPNALIAGSIACEPSDERRAVHFGAGNIGRGFIGMLLSKSGYEVCFVARNETQIAQFQKNKQYTVIYANERADSEVIRNVTAIPIKSGTDVNARLLTADLVTTAVGVSNLPAVARTMAAGIERRLAAHDRPLHIIACENATRGSTMLKSYIYEHLSAAARSRADRCLSFPDSMIDRIVPVQWNEDPLAIRVEPFCEWIIDRSKLMPGFRPIEGALCVDRLAPYAERKLYTVNTGHCYAAYLGRLAGFSTIQDTLREPALRERIRLALEETGGLLIRRHGFDSAEHARYIDKTVERFANPAIVDDVTRVARSPLRKLARSERLIRPLMLAHENGLQTPNLVFAAAAALAYADKGDPEAVRMQTAIQEEGLSAFVTQHLGIPFQHALHGQLLAAYRELRTEFG